MKTAAAALMMSVVGLCAVPAQAGTGGHIDEMANLLRHQTGGAANEIRTHLRNAPQYRHLYNDVYEMYRLAEHVHDMAHQSNAIVHLQHDIDELERLFHHAEGLVTEMKSYSTPTHGQHFGNGGFQVHVGQFAPHNYYLERLCRQFEQIENTLHHLQADIDTLSPVHNGHDHIRVQPAPVIVPNNQGNRWNWRPSRRSGLGISFSIR